MTLGATVRQGRERLEWTQSQLADRIGVTPSFITKVEKDEALPSYDRTLALARALDLDVNNLLSLVEQNKEDRGLQRIRNRGASMRTAFGLSTERDSSASEGRSTGTDPATQLAREILENPTLYTALTHLRIALRDPDLTAAVLKTLETFAKQATSKG